MPGAGSTGAGMPGAGMPGTALPGAGSTGAGMPGATMPGAAMMGPLGPPVPIEPAPSGDGPHPSLDVPPPAPPRSRNTKPFSSDVAATLASIAFGVHSFASCVGQTYAHGRLGSWTGLGFGLGIGP